MTYETATVCILKDIELKPDLIDMVAQQTGSRIVAISGIVASIAPNFVKPGEPVEPGQIAQGLSEWHKELASMCTEVYINLTGDPDGPSYSRSQANSSPELQTLQAVRRGIKLAMNNYYRYARIRSTKPKWARHTPLMPYFESN